MPYWRDKPGCNGEKIQVNNAKRGAEHKLKWMDKMNGYEEGKTEFNTIFFREDVDVDAVFKQGND